MATTPSCADDASVSGASGVASPRFGERRRAARMTRAERRVRVASPLPNTATTSIGSLHSAPLLTRIRLPPPPGLVAIRMSSLHAAPLPTRIRLPAPAQSTILNPPFAIRTLLTLLTATVIACTADKTGRAAPNADTAPEATVPDTSKPISSVAQRFRARVPDSVLVRRGACPFECCVYRNWTAIADIQVLNAPREGAARAFTITTGTEFRADSGNVYITGFAVVAVRDSVADRPYWAFGPGDTLVVLDHIGEGHYRVWHNGRVRETQGFWEAWSQPSTAELIGSYEAQWWVHATISDGRSGWFKVQRPMQFRGADQCA